MERLDKILANTGRWSRREAAELIKSGRVTVNGAAVLCREEKIPETVEIRVDGQVISGEKYVYLMMNKPAGLVSATEAPGEETVLSLLPEHLRRVGLFPAGRLDKDTLGLLLLTNDGPLAHALLSPNRHVDKIYYVEVEGELTQADVAAFAGGMTLADGLHCRPARLEITGPAGGFITLHEGKYHQIKRMCAAQGKPVRHLERVCFGPLRLDSQLARGAWRPLRQEEVTALQTAGGQRRER